MSSVLKNLIAVLSARNHRQRILRREEEQARAACKLAGRSSFSRMEEGV